MELRRHGTRLLVAGMLLASGCAAPAAVGGAEGTRDTPSATASPTTTTTPAPTATATATATGVPTPDHVVIVVMENKDVDQVLGSGQAPFFDRLAASGASLTNFHAETHPSQPNYLALFSGSTQGVRDDSCLPRFTGPNLASQLLTAGRTFVGYSEDLPAPGYTGCRSGDYAQKHSVWTAFDLPAATNQPFSAWPASFDQLPTVSFVIPNLCHDMHDCDVAAGDRWLSAHLSDYLAWAPSHRSLLVVTFDETDSHDGDNRIVTTVNGAGVRPGRFGEHVDHYRLLRTIQAMYGLPPLGRSAGTTPITGLWATAA